MDRETVGNRLSISIYGKRSSGKSRLMNNIIGQDISVVSKVKGTTTDPVSKAIEFGKIGPVLFTDTAGIDDSGVVGDQRVKKTMGTLEYTDLALYVMDSEDIDEKEYLNLVREFERYEIPHILVFNKFDKVDRDVVAPYREKYEDALFMSAKNLDDVKRLKSRIEDQLSRVALEPELLEGIVSEGDDILLVIPIDTAAPKGRLILPQVEAIREILDRNAVATVVKETGLDSVMDRIDDFSLVVVDSSIYGEIEDRFPEEIKLTTFSILFSRKKGELEYFVDSVKKLESLTDGDKVLICETCTHNTTHEDVGKVKIPNAISKYSQKKISYEYNCGSDFPENLEDYSLIVHCGSCMGKKNTLKRRMKKSRESGIPMTNYGVLLSYISGKLDRTIEFL